MLSLKNQKHFAYESAGEFFSEKEWIHPERSIATYEIIFVVEGTVYLEEDGDRYSLTKNQMILLDPHKNHLGFRFSAPPVSFYWFHFKTDLEPPCKVYSGEDYYDLKYLLKRLLHISNTPEYTAQASDAIGLLIFEELSHIVGMLEKNGRALLNKIIEYIRIHKMDNLSVAKIAAHFGYHPDYISKLFKQHYKTGLKEYLTTKKMNLAKDLLLTTNLSVKEIAANINFTSYHAFLKFFRYHEQITPSEFRNRYYNTHMNNH